MCYIYWGVSATSLISLWIPCAYLRGSGTSTHHCYQIYVRINDDEWNVYRRYSEFLDLHYFLQKQYPKIGSLFFPRKKAIGHKVRDCYLVLY